MPKDYAAKTRRKTVSRNSAQETEAATRRPALPAFVAGAACGVVATLLVGYAPGLWSGAGLTDAGLPAGQAPAEIAVTYEFMDRLPEDEVVTNVVPFEPPDETDAAATPAATTATAEPTTTYMLQAGAFRNRDDADALRADLLLEGMAVAINTAPRPAGGAWHRVLVGPFAERQDLRRALSRLREKDIPAMPILRTSKAKEG